MINMTINLSMTSKFAQVLNSATVVSKNSVRQLNNVYDLRTSY